VNTPLTTPRPTPLTTPWSSPAACLAAATVLATATTATAQDHEPFHLTWQNRSCAVMIEDAVWGTEPYIATNDTLGTWLESGSASNSGAAGESAQWTRIDESYIGGLLGCEISNWGGSYEMASAMSYARFEVDRTGRLSAFVEFNGHFASHLQEAHALFQLSRVDEDGNIVESIIDWNNYGTAGEETAHSYDTELLLRPGTYRLYQEVITDVLGVEISPDSGRMEMIGAIELAKLPDCGDPAAGTCTEAKSTPSCDDAVCCARICEMDPYCCDNRWDAICVAEAQESCITGCAGDLNHDGTVNGADQGLLFAAWGAHPPTHIHPADLNMDGVVNGTDLGMLFSHWGDC